MKIWPDAYCVRLISGTGYIVWPMKIQPRGFERPAIGLGKTASLAWANAWTVVSSEKKPAVTSSPSVATDERLGRVTYEAYAETRHWKNFDGKPLPTWDRLPTSIAFGWLKAAQAVKHAAIATYPSPEDSAKDCRRTKKAEPPATKIYAHQ